MEGEVAVWAPLVGFGQRNRIWEAGKWLVRVGMGRGV